MTAHIVVITNKFDAHADRVVELLAERSAHVYRINTETLLSEHVVTWRSDGDTHLATMHREVSLRDVTAVWYRKPSDYTVPDHLLDYEGFLREELRAVMGGIYRTTTHPLWVNPLDCQRRASYKLLQLELAQRIGLEIPDTIVTNNADVVAEFAARHVTDGIAIKTIGSGLVHLPAGKTIFTNRIDATVLKDEGRVKSFPQLYQAYVPKEVELRITVIGSRIFVAEMETQKSASPGTRIDWRRYDLENVPHRRSSLPAAIETKIFEFMNELGLVFGAIDMIRTPDGRHVFLEINPGGQWLWVEEMCELPISEALVDLLMRSA